MVGVFTILSKLVNLLILGYPAKVLGPENYGVYGYAVSIVAYVSIILLPGLSNWGAREIAVKPNFLDEIFSEVFILKLILSFVAYFILVITVYVTNANEQESYSILIYGLSLFTAAINTEWVFNGMQKMSIPAFTNFIQALCALFLTVYLVKDKNDLYLYSFIYPLCGTINIFIQIIYLKKIKVRINKFSFLASFKVIQKSYLLGISSSLVILLHYFNNLIIKYFLGTTSLAIYMAGFFFLEVFSTIPTIFSSIFQTRLAKNYNLNRTKALIESKFFAELHVIISFLLSIVLITAGPLLISFFFGIKYAESYTVVRIMAIAIIFNYAIFGYTNCLISFGYDKVFLKIIIISCLTAVLFGTLFTSLWGVEGASVAIILTDLVPFIFSLQYYKQAIGKIHLEVWILPFIGFISATIFFYFFLKQSTSIISNTFFVVLIYVSVISIRVFKIKKYLLQNV